MKNRLHVYEYAALIIIYYDCISHSLSLPVWMGRVEQEKSATLSTTTLTIQIGFNTILFGWIQMHSSSLSWILRTHSMCSIHRRQTAIHANNSRQNKTYSSCNSMPLSSRCVDRFSDAVDCLLALEGFVCWGGKLNSLSACSGSGVGVSKTSVSTIDPFDEPNDTLWTHIQRRRISASAWLWWRRKERAGWCQRVNRRTKWAIWIGVATVPFQCRIFIMS